MVSRARNSTSLKGMDWDPKVGKHPGRYIPAMFLLYSWASLLWGPHFSPIIHELRCLFPGRPAVTKTTVAPRINCLILLAQIKRPAMATVIEKIIIVQAMVIEQQ